MSKLIFPSDIVLDKSQGISVIPVDLEKEDPVLLELLR